MTGTVRLSSTAAARRSPVAGWALERFTTVLIDSGVRVAAGPAVAVDEVEVYADLVEGDEGSQTWAPESFHIERRTGGAATRVTVRSGDPRGLTYGLLELADRAAESTEPIVAIGTVPSGEHRPATAVRSVLRTFVSDVQDSRWYHDRQFWLDYLNHLVTHRINRFQLAFGMQYNYSHDPDVQDNYLAFAYPFLVDVPGFDVTVGGLSDEQRSQNLATLKFISQEAARRGIHFQLGLWNHAHAFPESEREKYPISGLSPANHAQYCAAALATVLAECADISGVTVRVHYEGGVHEPSHRFWDVVLQALKGLSRPVELDMHSKGVDERILAAARNTGAPLQISAKFWAEHTGLPYHQTAVRDLESARPDRENLSGVTGGSRRFTRYGYGDFLREDRDYALIFRIWPGTQRVLLWGDPEQVAALARAGTLVGSQGLELCEPLTFLGRKTTGTVGGRQPYVDRRLRTDGDPWTKYAYVYRLWGRLLYEPDHDPDGWRRHLERVYGCAGVDVEAALSAASKILPLVTTQHAPSASNNFYWPEMYTNMPLARMARSELYQFDSAPPGTVGAVGAFDPGLFDSIDAHVEDLLAGRVSGRYTPADVAGWLDRLVSTAEQHLVAALARSEHADDAAFRRTTLDVAVLTRLGAFFAAKLRAGLAYAVYARAGEGRYLQDAVDHYRHAHRAYAAVAALTTGTYTADLAFGDRGSERGHWADRLPAIAADLADLEAELGEAGSAADSAGESSILEQPHRAKPPQAGIAVADTFASGVPLAVAITMRTGGDYRVQLHYRHLNQGEQWLTTAMTVRGRDHVATIPEEFTRTAFSIQLYFTVRDAQQNAWVLPGLPTLTSQPYLVLQQATSNRGQL